MRTIVWAGAFILNAVGAAVFAEGYDETGHPGRFIGLGLVLVGWMFAATAMVISRQRTLDEEFEAGYRAGHRAGRRAVTPSGIVSIDRRRFRRAGVPKAPVRPVAGHRAAAGRHTANEV